MVTLLDQDFCPENLPLYKVLGLNATPELPLYNLKELPIYMDVILKLHCYVEGHHFIKFLCLINYKGNGISIFIQCIYIYTCIYVIHSDILFEIHSGIVFDTPWCLLFDIHLTVYLIFIVTISPNSVSTLKLLQNNP